MGSGGNEGGGTTTTSGEVGSGGNEGGQPPVTGTNELLTALLGLAVLLVGASLVLVARRPSNR